MCVSWRDGGVVTLLMGPYGQKTNTNCCCLRLLQGHRDADLMHTGSGDGSWVQLGPAGSSRTVVSWVQWDRCDPGPAGSGGTEVAPCGLSWPQGGQCVEGLLVPGCSSALCMLPGRCGCDGEHVSAPTGLVAVPRLTLRVGGRGPGWDLCSYAASVETLSPM